MRVRNWPAAVAMLAILAGCGGGGGGGTITIPPNFTVTANITVDPACTPAAPTAEANGIDVCLVTIDLTLDPPPESELPEAGIFISGSPTAGGPGYLFYEDPDIVDEPLSEGRRPRVYTVGFDPDTGDAPSIQVYVRSTVVGTGQISIDSGPALSELANVEFAVDASAPASILLTANSFVGDGGCTLVTAQVLNALDAPIPNSAVDFTLEFSSNDPFGEYDPADTGTCPTPSAPVVRTIQDHNDGINDEAAVTFYTTDETLHAVTITAEIVSPISGVTPAQASIQVYDSVSAASAARYTFSSVQDGRPSDSAMLPADVDAFFGDAAGTADIVGGPAIGITGRIRSIDEVAEDRDCDCDPAVDPEACTDTGAGNTACPATGLLIEIDCPSGLNNPAQIHCEFSINDTSFADVVGTPGNTGCTNGQGNRRCVRFLCPGGATACTPPTFFWRIVSNSVAKQTSRSDDLHPVKLRFRAPVTSTPDLTVDRTGIPDGDPAILPESVVFMPDPSRPAKVVFTKPLSADDGDVGGVGNRNCTVATVSGSTSPAVIQCSDEATDYTQVESNVNRPRVPVRFEIQNALGDVFAPGTLPIGADQITFALNGPAGVPPYEVCQGAGNCQSPAVSSGLTTTGDLNYPAATGVLGDYTNLFLYPAFSPSVPYGIDVSVNIGGQLGFTSGNRVLQFNPECETPYNVTCSFASASGPPPVSPPACYPGAVPIKANGTECEFVTCQVQSFAQANPGGAAAALGCPNAGTPSADPVNSNFFGIRLLADADTETETFCAASGSCTGAFASEVEDILTPASPAARAQFYMKVDSNQTASATFSPNFIARVRRAGTPGSLPLSDLDPQNLIQAAPSFTAARDPALPATVQLSAVKVNGTALTNIFSQHAADSGTAKDLVDFHGITPAIRFGDPFAARIDVTIKDFDGNNYLAAGNNPECEVTLSATGSAQGTAFPAFVTGSCSTAAPPPSRPLAQTEGNALVQSCLISNGLATAATGTATVQAQFTGATPCGPTGTVSTNVTVNSVVRSVRYIYNVHNLTGASMSFNAVQANSNLSGVTFCKPSDVDCNETPQPEAFLPVGILSGKGALGNLTDDESQLAALYSETLPNSCANPFAVGAGASSNIWQFDVSLHPDAPNTGVLLDRLSFTTTAADAVFRPTPAPAFQEVNQLTGSPPLCLPQTIPSANLAVEVQVGQARYYGQ
ncbi:MAG: hypothetical protein AB1405_02995 [Bdellovibrionota bacterium]